MTEPPLISIVGGGVYAPRLCQALARVIDIRAVELRLSALDPDRLRILATHAQALVTAIRPGWTVTAAPDIDAAVAGASIVILLVRVGGFAARSWDEEFPRRFGFVGDEGLGPGGLANAWRTVPTLTEIAATIRTGAPGARILNLMAPLGITTRLLLDVGLCAIGLCELPVVTLQDWLSRAQAPADQTRWQYGGLNHLGWFWDVRHRGCDLLQLLADEKDTVRNEYPVDREILNRFQAAPLRYYYQIFDAQARARTRLEQRPNRAGELARLAGALIRYFAESPGSHPGEEQLRPTPWLDLAVAPIAAALLNGPPHAGFANVRNAGRIPELPAEAVVELAARFTEQGCETVSPGPLPIPVASFLSQVAAVDNYAYSAATQREPQDLLKAIQAMPLPISVEAAVALAELARKRPPEGRV
jgi:alpha-galactosidase/6-phospho-beta-glucosidase family protein